ncbi:Hsp70 family protein [Dactylosporangium sp. NPDC005572]|uniref:Hsp70 family protein n=1 Tax=Dactylosporangium sp. NPDC005572 TaxID=3156889 RepID=UPI0033B39AD0
MRDVELAIDYGTSNTVALLRWPDGRTRPLLFDGTPLLPSAVWADDSRRLLTGRDAQRSARHDPARYEPNPKRRIDELEVLLGDTAYPVQQLIAATVGRVVREAQQAAGGPIGPVTVTHPVAWGPARRAVLTAAAADAGIAEPTLLAEPIAAATYLAGLAGHPVRPGQCVLVYDLGAGTFDATVVRRTETGFEALAYRGLDDVGGLDLDAVIVQLVAATVRPEETDRWQQLLSPTNAEQRRQRILLWQDACDAKELLSRQPATAMHVSGLGRDVMITRAELEEAAAPLLRRTVDTAAATLRESRLVEGQLVAVFLVGGGSLMPQVATMLHRALGVPPMILEQPQLVVCEGALAGGLTPPKEPRPAPLPEPLTPEPLTPEPVAPTPVAAAPVAPTPVAAEAVVPPSVAPQPVAPQPVAAQPVTPAPVAPRPVTPAPQRTGKVPGAVWLGAGIAALVLLLAFAITAAVDVHFDADDVSFPFWLAPLVAGQVLAAGELVRRVAVPWVWLLVVVLAGIGLATPAEDDVNSLSMLITAALLAVAAVYLRPGRSMWLSKLAWAFGISTAVSLIPMIFLSISSRGAGGPEPLLAALVPTVLGIAGGLLLVLRLNARREAAPTPAQASAR